MSDEGRVERFIRTTARGAGQRYTEIRHAYRDGREIVHTGVPRDGENVKLVCRRYAEKRAVSLSEYEPECFDPDHRDCQGCVEDIRDGTVETW